MDKKLMKVLACPKCKANLKKMDKSVVCNKCKVEYLINDDIPNMLIKDTGRTKQSLC